MYNIALYAENGILPSRPPPTGSVVSLTQDRTVVQGTQALESERLLTIAKNLHAQLLDYPRMPRQREERVTHENGCRLVGGNPDPCQLRAKLDLVWYLVYESPEEVIARLPVRGSRRLAAAARLIQLLVLKWRDESKEMWSYLAKLAVDLETPIFQMFMRPLGKPWVVVADFRESEDIQLRRQGEFDRSTFLGEVFGPLLPHSHVGMPTFYGVVAPAIRKAMQGMLELWRERASLAQGRPIRAEHDITRCIVDVVLSATYGIEAGAIKAQTNALSEGDRTREAPDDPDAPAEFPTADDSAVYKAVRALVDSIQIAMSSPVPRQHLTLALKLYPALATARSFVDKLMTERLEATWKKFCGSEEQESWVTSAMDLLVQQEAQMAQKEARPVLYDTPAIRDELFGFFVAGHETTSTTIL
ncbi:hypothetical protein DL768_002770 [Monosporascus sp. mg162]|nr:hypothetical protein DL768_002770 [Monosporascus sp. mg162]